MKIEISDDKTAGQISDEFNKQWPNLKIEFFRHTHQSGQASPKKEQIAHYLFLKSIRNLHNESTVLIKATDRIKDIEKRFEDNYGLHIKIFHKTGDNWIEATKTADWTIDQMNKHSSEFDQPVKEEITPFEEEVQ